MRRRGGHGQAGVTLIEMLIVATILSIMVGISFPAVSAGIDSLRLSTSADSVAAFLNSALNRADRRQEPVEILVDKEAGSLSLRSLQPGFVRRYDLPDGVRIRSLLPPMPVPESGQRSFWVLPGGSFPRFGVELENRRGARRIVRVDPITGAPEIRAAEEEAAAEE